MAVKKIVQIPDPILKEPCKEVTEFDAELKDFIVDLIDSLNSAHDPPGAGLSAPQIGVSKRICVARRFYESEEYVDDETQKNEETQKYKDYVLINPKITSASNATEIKWEACLSIPDVYGMVQRHKRITVKAQDENGNPLKIKASGFFARVIQHEIDHLDGVLFTSKVIGETKTEEELDQI